MTDATTHGRIFISYARADGRVFADELVAALEAAGFDPFLDRQDIAPGEDWEHRLGTLIASSDTVVFVLTPVSLRSERCAWEVETARGAAKRILPVLAAKLNHSDIPAELAKLNFVSFAAGRSFGEALKELVAALKVDATWLREHTRLATLASRWSARGEPDDALLRGQDLKDALVWIASKPASHDADLAAIKTFLANGERSEHESLEAQLGHARALLAAQGAKAEVQLVLARRTVLGLVASGALTIASAGLAYWGVSAEGRFQQERRRAEQAFQDAQSEAVEREAARTDLAGQMKVYAGAPGGDVVDNPEQENSSFTVAVLSALKGDTSLSLFDAVLGAKERISALSKGRQSPYIGTDLNGQIYLAHPSPTRRKLAFLVYVNELEDGRKLPNASNDVRLWDNFLYEAGFESRIIANPSARELADAIGLAKELQEYQRDFSFAPAEIVVEDEEGNVVKPGTDSILIFYYSGYGFSSEGREYLACRDSSASDFDSLTAASFPVDLIAEKFNGAYQASVLILDSMFQSILSAESSGGQSNT